MSYKSGTFVLRLRDRKVLVFHDQCPRYSDVLALARSTFSSLRHTAAEDIVILGNGPWYDNVELSPRAWETFYSQVTYVTVTFKQEREQLEREQHKKVDSKPELESE